MHKRETADESHAGVGRAEGYERGCKGIRLPQRKSTGIKQAAGVTGGTGQCAPEAHVPHTLGAFDAIVIYPSSVMPHYPHKVCLWLQDLTEWVQKVMTKEQKDQIQVEASTQIADGMAAWSLYPTHCTPSLVCCCCLKAA